MTHQPFQISRRKFLKSSAALAAATGIPAWYLDEIQSHAASAPSLSPNDRPNVALIGCGGQGRYDTTLAAKFANIVAVCDVDAGHAEAAAKQFNGAQPYSDFRKLLERGDLHAVINGTPDHWHTLINIATMKAGMDVYSEKPLTLTIDEGKHLVRVARETNRILQTGSQQRSDPQFRLACELVRNGRIGKLKHIVTSLPAGPRAGPFSTSPVPAGLNWDFWQGQTPSVPYVKQRCHSSFRYWWDYSGGTMTDWGAHHNDIALWGLGLEPNGPATIEGKATVPMIPGGYTAAAEYQVDYTYSNGVTQRCQSTSGNGPDGSLRGALKSGEMFHGVRFEGSDGWIFVTRGKIEASQPELLSVPLTNKTVSLYVSDNHMGNFLACVRSRKPAICDAETGHRSVSLCHLGVIAIRLGRKLHWDPAKEQCINDKQADGWLARVQRKPWTYDMV
jgi:predicted dehydrogenase